MININNKNWDLLEKVLSNIQRPLSILTYNKYRYFLTFLDIKSRYLEVILLRHKDKAFSTFKKFKNKYKNISNKRIKIFNIDNSKKDINKEFNNLLNKSSITTYNNPPYTKENLSIIERINLTIIDKA